MLVLGRQVDERITIFGTDNKPVAEVVVIKTERGRVRLGIVAEANIRIARNELLEKDAAAKEAA